MTALTATGQHLGIADEFSFRIFRFLSVDLGDVEKSGVVRGKLAFPNLRSINHRLLLFLSLGRWFFIACGRIELLKGLKIVVLVPTSD